MLESIQISSWASWGWWLSMAVMYLNGRDSSNLTELRSSQLRFEHFLVLTNTNSFRVYSNRITEVLLSDQKLTHQLINICFRSEFRKFQKKTFLKASQVRAFLNLIKLIRLINSELLMAKTDSKLWVSNRVRQLKASQLVSVTNPASSIQNRMKRVQLHLQPNISLISSAHIASANGK